MNFQSSVVKASALLAIVGGALGAQAPSNTGASGNVVGGVDTRWEVSTNNGATWIAAFQVQNPPSPPWEPNTTDYSWISATSSGTGGGGNYLFRMFFDLSAYDPSAVALSFRCAIDNEAPQSGGYYSLNGSAFGGVCGSGQTTNFRFGPTQTLPSGFVSGLNEIQFHVTGDSQTDGLVVGNMSLEAVGPVSVPEPASLALVATGLVGVFNGARRRTQTLRNRRSI